MAPGVRYLRTKTVVKLAALEMFLEDFCPDRMIEALIEMCELAGTHPQFGKRDVDDASLYDWADQATDILTTFLLSRHCCEDGAEDAPRVQLDAERGALELLKPRIRRRPPAPSLAHAVTPVRPRILQRSHAVN